MSGLQITPRARADLLEIAEYISRDSRSAAANVIRSVRQTRREFIALHPKSGAPCEHLAEGLRYRTVGEYVVRGTNPIQIVRVLHGARDMDAMFRRSDHP